MARTKYCFTRLGRICNCENGWGSWTLNGSGVATVKSCVDSPECSNMVDVIENGAVIVKAKRFFMIEPSAFDADGQR